MTPAQEALVERLRVLLSGQPGQREVSMFGGRSFMVRDKLLVCALKDGDLLVRVPADRHDELLREHGATQAQMGPSRDMGPGWIDVDGDALRDDERLSFWCEIALVHNGSLAR